MKINDRVTVKTNGGPCHLGTVLAVEHYNKSVMYLVALEDYPIGIWFFDDIDHTKGVLIELYESA